VLALLPLVAKEGAKRALLCTHQGKERKFQLIHLIHVGGKGKKKSPFLSEEKKRKSVGLV